jgi:1,4-dihydroxy-2-naphthoate polyprenyltransferase
MSYFKIWFLAIRPKTLIASISPVCIGTTLSLVNNSFVINYKTFYLTLFFALFIQIATNLCNDYYDFIKGADSASRKGPLRVTANGYVKPKSMKIAFIICFIFAFIISIFLSKIGGIIVLIMSVICILSGFFYTAGPKPLGYIGLGELFVLLFFGPIAVGGTFYLQTGVFDALAFLAGLGPGCISTAILVTNNLRDLNEDKKVQKNTLCVVLGQFFSQKLYLGCLIFAFLIPLFFALISHRYYFSIATCFLFLLCLPLIKAVFIFKNPQVLNFVLQKTALILFIYTLIFSSTILL